MGAVRRLLSCALLCLLTFSGYALVGCQGSPGSSPARRAQALPTAADVDGGYETRREILPRGYASAGRWFYLHVRRDAFTPEPLVLLMHGLYQTPQTVESATGAIDFSQSHHFTLVFPVGVNKAWNAGGCCRHDTANDVGYLVDVVNYVSRLTPVDRRHVYVWGFSNGGMMAWRAVCQTSGVFAGAGDVDGALLVGCPHPVHVVDIHGLRDKTVPFHGGYSSYTHTVFPDSATERQRLAFGSTLRLVLFPNLGHSWTPLRRGGPDALDLLWQGLRGYGGGPVGSSVGSSATTVSAPIDG